MAKNVKSVEREANYNAAEAIKLTTLEATALKFLWKSSRDSRHDFGFTSEMGPSISKASRGGIAASLQSKGIIHVYSQDVYQQFVFTDVGKLLFKDFNESEEIYEVNLPTAENTQTEKAAKKAKKAAKKTPTEALVMVPDDQASTYPTKTGPFIWSPTRVALVKALRALHAVGAANGVGKAAISAKSGVETKLVSHYLYKDNDMVTNGYVGCIKGLEGTRGVSYYLTAKGASCPLPSKLSQ